MLAVNDNEPFAAGPLKPAPGVTECPFTSRDRALTSVAHDLRTPLSSILISAGILANRIGEGAETRAIRRAVLRASALIDDLLLATALESGELPLDRQPCRVSRLLGEIARDYDELATAAGIELVIVHDADLEATIDRRRVTQMLSNLVANALKFTAAGGRVDVRAGFGDAIVFEVSDDGCGIAPQHLPHVFDRFWRAPGSRGAGNGLGLAIVRGVVAAHAGHVEVSSVVGHGTKFTVTLPISNDRCVSIAPAPR